MNARTLGLTIASMGLLAALPCATPGNIREGINTANDAANTVGKGVRLAEDRAACDKTAAQPVSYNEEYSVGSATAVGFVKNNGGLILSYVDADKAELEKSVKFNEDAAEHKRALYVATVGKNLALQSPRSQIVWTFGVLKNDSDVNAFSAPGGFVLITNGAMKAAKNEDQLAGILAHEIGHIVKKHGIKYYLTQKAESCKAAVTLNSDAAADVKQIARNFFPAIYDVERLASAGQRLIKAGSDAFDFDNPTNFDLIQAMAEKAGETIAAGYSQDMEYEADQVAADLLLSAGYSVDEYGKFVSTLSGSKTHPGGADRQKALTTYVASKKKEDPFAGPDSKRKPIPLAVK